MEIVSAYLQGFKIANIGNGSIMRNPGSPSPNVMNPLQHKVLFTKAGSEPNPWREFSFECVEKNEVRSDAVTEKLEMQRRYVSRHIYIVVKEFI